jgi:signal transduction histidine kinase
MQMVNALFESLSFDNKSVIFTQNLGSALDADSFGFLFIFLVYIPLIIPWSWIYGIALIVVSVVSVVVYFNNRLIHQRRLEERKQEVLKAELMIRSQDAERYRIAAELHDSFGNHLAVLNNYSFRKYPNDQELNKYIQRLTFELRQINEDLSGKSVHAMGLEAAFQELCRQWHSEAGVWIEFNYQVKQKLILAQQLTIYRILQELVKNAIDRGKSTMILIEISNKNDVVHAEVTDNGVGIPSGTKFRGLGLGNIEARIFNLNGYFHVSSTQEGATFTLGFPLLT